MFRKAGTWSVTRRNSSSYSPPEIISPHQTDRISSTQGVPTCWSVTDIGRREETLLDPPGKGNGQAHITTTLHGVSQMKRKTINLPAFPSLPKERTWATRTFQNVGLDHMGPITVRDLTGPCKRWIALFIRLATRAIHLEVTENLSAEQFLHILRRFITRNGYPTSVVLDNAPQFQLVKQVMQNTLAAPITWRFIIPSAPWQGGVYERLVGLTKTVFRKAVGRRLLDEEEFKTLVVECEPIVNSRPLTYVDSGSERILGPVDFLRPQRSVAAEGPSPEHDKGLQHTADRRGKLLGLWKATISSLERFWKIWTHDYLMRIRERHCMEHQQPSRVTDRAPLENEIVIVAQEGLSRAEWKLGKVEKLYKNHGGKIKAVDVKMPCAKEASEYVVPLEVSEEEKKTQNDTSLDTACKFQRAEVMKNGVAIEFNPEEQPLRETSNRILSGRILFVEELLEEINKKSDASMNAKLQFLRNSLSEREQRITQEI